MNSFLALIPPNSLVPNKFWNEPNTTMGFDLSHALKSKSSLLLSFLASLSDTNCQPSKSK